MILQPDMVKSKSDRIQCLLSLFRFQLTFPYGDTMPAHLSQFALFLLITLLVPSNLRHPKIMICCWYFATGRALHRARIHKMSMPKATIDKDARPVFPQHQVWMTRQPFVVQPVTESSLPQPTTHNHLWLRIFRTNGRHILMPLLWGEFIHIRIFLLHWGRTVIKLHCCESLILITELRIFLEDFFHIFGNSFILLRLYYCLLLI